MMKKSFFGGRGYEMARVEVKNNTKRYLIDGGEALIEVSKEKFVKFMNRFNKLLDIESIKKEYDDIMSLV